MLKVGTVCKRINLTLNLILTVFFKKRMFQKLESIFGCHHSSLKIIVII